MVKLSEIDLPVVLEKKLLFGPGKWNDWNIAEEEVLDSIKNTDWNKKSRSIFYSHEDDKAEKWVGSVTNERLIDGKVYGDLKICDADLAFKLTDGEAPFAVSAGIKWPAEYRDPTNFSYRNFSMVINPGVHDEEIYINFADKGKNTFNEAKLIYSKANFEEKAVKEAEEKPSEEVKETPTEKINETSIKEEEKPTEKADDVSTEEVDDTSTEGVEDASTEESNLNSVERRLKNMVNEEKKTEEKVEETKEETKVETVEEVKEEVKEDTKAEFSELKSKLDEAISRIKVLETKQANFEAESKEEVKEESKEEEKVEEKSETADFTKVVEKLDRVVDALEKKAAPMTKAEFSGKSDAKSVTERLTSFLSD